MNDEFDSYSDKAYRFISFEGFFNTLKSRSLRFTRVDEFNDPLDNSPYLMNLNWSEISKNGKDLAKLNITFTQEKFMKQLPFTQFGFNFYDNQKISQLINKTPFQIVHSDTQTDNVKSKIGDFLNREFTTITYYNFKKAINKIEYA